jgi:RHS repeat-associated protein
LKQVTKGGTTVRFTYRADGLRARKEVVGGVTIDYVYDGQTVIGEKRSDGKSVWYTPGPMGYISRTVVNDATGLVIDKEWFVYDGLGSCRAMVKPNSQGTDAIITARMDYDVYGKVRTQTGSTESKFKYVASIGHPTDEETGLIYMRARYYEPGVGRFVSEDPSGDGVNWYLYADANPVAEVDVDGHWGVSDMSLGFAIMEGLLSAGLDALLQQIMNGSINWWEVGAAGVVGFAFSRIMVWSHFAKTTLGRRAWVEASGSFKTYFNKLMGIGTETSKRRYTFYPLWRTLTSGAGTRLFAFAYNTYIAGYLEDD